MLTGQLPFKGDYESAVIYSIINESPEPITVLRIGVPMELERIINKCLQKNPAERYQHLDELIVDLKGLKSEPTGTVTKEEKQQKRFKSVLLPIAIISIILLIIAGYLLIQPGEKSASEWENSIAVLPFADLSPNKDQEFFCDGMIEQIITNLSKINRLKVIGRTSVMKFKNTEKTLPEIGKELNVSHILEGSIRKYGNSIRVTAQLINTEDGSHIWADEFDRKLEHVFEVQDDVSEAIATNLLASLSPQDKNDIKTNRPGNIEAYEYYMKGRYYHYNKYWGATINKDDFKTSEQMFLKAIDRDPEYALSYASLADLYNTYCHTTVLTESEYNNYLRMQRFYLNRALELNSNLAEVQIIDSWIHQDYDEIYEAYKSIKKALKLTPNNSYANFTMARFFHSRGLINIANRYFVKAIETDPLQPMNYAWNAHCLSLMGKYQESENNLKRALEIDPDHFVTIVYYIWLLIASERYDEANIMLVNYYEVYGNNINMIGLRAMLFAISADKENALKNYPEGHYYKYYIYAVLSMIDSSIDYLNDLFNDRWAQIEESRYIELKMNPLLDNLRSDPRFREILAKHKELYEENLHKYADIEEY
jgi:TolB-like protein/Tfp pilus assembly protein PilF